MTEGVSIVICCFNSATRIRKTLEHLSRFNVAGIQCEIVLVDNASTDSTAEIARDIWDTIGPKEIGFKIATEDTPGHMFARLKGLNEARFAYIVFCDDDNWLDAEYAQNVIKLFNANPDVALLTGPGTAEFESPDTKPAWFENFREGFAVGSVGTHEQFVNSTYGAGLAGRTVILKNILTDGGMLLQGRQNNQLSSGDDTELCYRVRLMGHKILYSPVLTFKHFLPQARLNWAYVKKLFSGFAGTNVIVTLYERALDNPSPLPLLFWLKKSGYYWGIYFKYWFKQYLVYSKQEGTVEEIRHIMWRIIASQYFAYNFRTRAIYNQILNLKNT